MLVALSLAWGLSWPAMKIALDEIPPFSLRVGTCVLGAPTLFAVGLVQHRDLRIRPPLARLHLVVAGLPQRGVLHAVVRLRATRDHDLARHSPYLHHADLGGLLAHPILGERLNLARGSRCCFVRPDCGADLSAASERAT